MVEINKDVFYCTIKTGYRNSIYFEAPSQIHFCDFSSAGNSWDPKTRYKVWLPEPLNVMKNKYQEYQEGPG